MNAPLSAPPAAPGIRSPRLVSSRQVLFVLKTLNLAVITVYSFALIYVLVRVLSLDLYPTAVVMSSIGAYVLATDLGYSGFLYYRLRQRFLRESEEEEDAVSEVLTLYAGIALAAAAVMAAVVLLFLSAPLEARVALSVYFLSIVLALPWMLIRRISAAVDLFMRFEAYELVRRVFFLGMALAMLKGLPFFAFCLICLAAWGMAFAAGVHMLRSRGIHVSASPPSAIFMHLRDNWRDVGHSGSLTLVEFVIYNFPYLVLPALFHDRIAVIAFDVFYKVVRFGAVSYGVPAETLLPGQTRAFYAGDVRSVKRHFYLNLALGAVPLLAAAVLVLLFGDRIFAVLLSKGGIVDENVRIAMVIMLAAMLFQNSAGTFLTGTGNYRQLSRLALVTATLMAAAVAATWWLGLSFAAFLFLYVGIYCLHALLFCAYLLRFLVKKRPESGVQAEAAP